MNNFLKDFLEKSNDLIEEKHKEKIEILASELIKKCVDFYTEREGVLILNENLIIEEVDIVFLDWFSIKKEEIIGKKFIDLFDNNYIDVLNYFINKVKKEKYSKKDILPLIINKKEIYVEIKGESLIVENKPKILINLKKKEVNLVAYKLRVIEEDIANLIIRIKSFDALMKEIINVFINSDIFDFGWVAKINMDLKKIIPVITAKEDKIDIEFKEKMFEFSEFEDILEVLIKNEEIVFEDVQFREVGYKKEIIFPLYKKWDYEKSKEIAYAVLIFSEKDFKCSESELNILREIFYKINIAITDIFIKEKANLIISTDTLTMLPKRDVIIKKTEELINENIPFALAIVDIDKLKKVNDVLGFWAGDKAIKRLADFLKENLKRSIIGRVGSDEFAVIICGGKTTIYTELNKILKFNDNIVQINGSGVYLPISIGVAFYPEDGIKKEDIFILAEKALEEAKKKGGKNITYSNKKINFLPKDYLEIEKELKEAIEKNEYIMHYQPIIDLKAKNIWGVEALVRWNSKTRGLVPPGQFISILEESGLINEVGDIIIDKVLLDSKKLNNLIFTFSMNLSVTQILSQNIAKKIIDKVKQHKINSENIIVEITESVIMENIDTIMPQLELLKENNIKIEIDDFGTGYSSLSYLKKLPVSALKIDRSFVIDILENEESKAIIQAIISMAKALNKKTIAEGVESKEVMLTLKEVGVDYIQGFYFAKPMPFENLKEYIKNFYFDDYIK